MRASFALVAGTASVAAVWHHSDGTEHGGGDVGLLGRDEEHLQARRKDDAGTASIDGCYIEVHSGTWHGDHPPGLR